MVDCCFGLDLVDDLGMLTYVFNDYVRLCTEFGTIQLGSGKTMTTLESDTT